MSMRAQVFRKQRPSCHHDRAVGSRGEDEVQAAPAEEETGSAVRDGTHCRKRRIVDAAPSIVVGVPIHEGLQWMCLFI